MLPYRGCDASLKCCRRQLKYFNKNGRAIPDVAAYGTNYAIYWQGQKTRLYGTSAAAPTFASVIALMNQKRRASGKSSLGWIHPFLYSRFVY